MSPDLIIQQFVSKIDLIRNVYYDIKDKQTQWPEKHLYDGNWLAVPLKYNYNFIINSPLDTLLQDAPIALFSILKPNTQLKKHRGYPNYAEFVWRFHICLESSNNTLFVVDEQMYTWEAGEGFYFDDSKEHWGWNRGNNDRVALVFDLPRTDFKPPMSQKMEYRFK